MASFADAEAWDARYAADAAEYDWLLDWSSLAEPILALCGPTTRVLDVGCGTSCVPARLADAGVAHVSPSRAKNAGVNIATDETNGAWTTPGGVQFPRRAA